MRRTLRGLQVLLESCARHLPVAASRSPSACRISHLSMCSTPLLAMKVRLRDLDEHERRQCADRPVECQYCQRAFVQLPLCAHHNPWLPRCCATHSTHAACFVCCPLHATLNTPRCMQLAAHCMLRAFRSAACWSGARTPAVQVSGFSPRLTAGRPPRPHSVLPSAWRRTCRHMPLNASCGRDRSGRMRRSSLYE